MITICLNAHFLWNYIWDVENRWISPAITLDDIKNYKNIIQLLRLLLLHFNICGLVRREIRRNAHSMWWLLNVRHPSTKRKWWIWSSLNAISCANKSQTKVHHSSYLRAHFIAFSSEWIPHTLSLCQTKFTHMSVDWRQGIHTLTQCMRIKEKFFLDINSISSFVVDVAVVFTWHTVGVCVYGFLFSSLWPRHYAMCMVLFVKIRTPCYNFSDVKLPAGDVSLIKMTCKEPISARVAALCYVFVISLFFSCLHWLTLACSPVRSFRFVCMRLFSTVFSSTILVVNSSPSSSSSFFRPFFLHHSILFIGASYFSISQVFSRPRWIGFAIKSKRMRKKRRKRRKSVKRSKMQFCKKIDTRSNVILLQGKKTTTIVNAKLTYFIFRSCAQLTRFIWRTAWKNLNHMQLVTACNAKIKFSLRLIPL